MNKQFSDAYLKEVVDTQDPHGIGVVDGYSMALRDCIEILSSHGRSAIQQIYLCELKELQDEFLTKVKEFGMLGNYREYLKKKWEGEERTDEEKFILAKENHERIYCDLVPKWNLIKNHPIKTNAPPGGAIQGYIITQSPSMRFFKIYYEDHPHNIGVDLKEFVELKRMITFEEVKNENSRSVR